MPKTRHLELKFQAFETTQSCEVLILLFFRIIAVEKRNQNPNVSESNHTVGSLV